MATQGRPSAPTAHLLSLLPQPSTSPSRAPFPTTAPNLPPSGTGCAPMQAATSKAQASPRPPLPPSPTVSGWTGGATRSSATTTARGFQAGKSKTEASPALPPEGGKPCSPAAQGCKPRSPPRLVVAESAIDAMSYWQHDPAPALVLSFGGEMSPEQPELLRHVLAKYPAAEIVTATDADAQGDGYAALIEAVRPDAIRARPPTGKDWNDAIRPKLDAVNQTPRQARLATIARTLAGITEWNRTTTATRSTTNGKPSRRHRPAATKPRRPTPRHGRSTRPTRCAWTRYAPFSAPPSPHPRKTPSTTPYSNAPTRWNGKPAGLLPTSRPCCPARATVPDACRGCKGRTPRHTAAPTDVIRPASNPTRPNPPKAKTGAEFTVSREWAKNRRIAPF